MTPTELYQYLQDRLGGTNFGLSPSVLWRYLTRAQNHVVESTQISFRADVPVLTTAGIGTYDLSNAGIISYTAGCSLKDLKRVGYNLNRCLKKRNVGWIQDQRLRQSNCPWDPAYYAFHYQAGKPTLELWPAAKHSISAEAVDSAYLHLDITEEYPALSAETATLIAPPYAHECIYLWAAFYVFDDFGDERRFSLSNAAGMGTADKKLKAVRAQSVKNASGDGEIGYAH
ncbi:MAG: hypothetical protein C4519_00325 [Desulfobacteraceae bacterium]|nr:MAG: hypothetical protein C4519_00325 [Desulfobacteraceae bacterium]